MFRLAPHYWSLFTWFHSNRIAHEEPATSVSYLVIVRCSLNVYNLLRVPGTVELNLLLRATRKCQWRYKESDKAVNRWFSMKSPSIQWPGSLGSPSLITNHKLSMSRCGEYHACCYGTFVIHIGPASVDGVFRTLRLSNHIEVTTLPLRKSICKESWFCMLIYCQVSPSTTECIV